MKKIPTIYVRDFANRGAITDQRNPECEWVFAGEGIPTRKYDGTCCMVRDGKLYKRYDAKKGRTPPANFEPAQEADPQTGHQPGWVPVGDGPDDKYFREAIADGVPTDGTYELCGPKVQGNPEKLDRHDLIPHGAMLLNDVPRTFDLLREWLMAHDYEGIVFHHPDGRMAKIKKRDFQ